MVFGTSVGGINPQADGLSEVIMTTKEELFCRGCSHRAGFTLPGLWSLSPPFGCDLTLLDLGPASLVYVHLFHTPSPAGAPLYTISKDHT